MGKNMKTPLNIARNGNKNKSRVKTSTRLGLKHKSNQTNVAYGIYYQILAYVAEEVP